MNNTAAATINNTNIDTLPAFFSRAFHDFPQETLIREMKNGNVITTTYAQFAQEVATWTAILRHYDIRPGDRIGILARSSPNWIKGFVAALNTHATVVCLDIGLDDSQLIRLIEHSELKLLLIASHDAASFTKIAYASVTTLDLDQKLKEINQTTSHLQSSREVDPSIACILYTSGTTGLFKGVLLEHSAILSAVRCNKAMTRITSHDQALCILPAHHVYGLVCVIITPFIAGASILFPEKLDGPNLLQALTVSKPTIIVGVPRVFQLFGNKIDSEIAKKPAFIRKIIHSLLKTNLFLRNTFSLNIGKIVFSKIQSAFGGHVRLCVSGGAPLDASLFSKMYGFGFTLIEGYGLTETCASVIANPVNKPKPGSVGIAMQGVEIRIEPNPEAASEDDHANAESQGVIGEICVKGPMLMRSYFRDTTATNDAIRNGWYHTGDLGKIDSEGYVYITGRIKEIIVLANGKKIMPSMVEAYFSDLPGASDFALVGIAKSEGGGEELHAAVVIDSQTKLPAKEAHRIIEQHIRERLNKLPEWWRFKKIHFLDNIPRTTTLKVKRKALSELLRENHLV